MQKKLEQKILAKIKTRQIKIKPKIYFYLGSFLLVLSTFSLILLAVFMTNLNIYRFRLYQIRFLPLEFILLNLILLILAFYLLKKFEFSYKKNINILFLGFLSLIILASLIFDLSGINQKLKRRAILKAIYEHRLPRPLPSPRPFMRPKARVIYQLMK